jgi:hypothetical protein
MSLDRRTFLRAMPAAGAAVALPAAALAVGTEMPVASQQVQEAIDAHAKAHTALCKACDETDEVALKRQPTKAAIRQYDHANRAERKALLDLCAYPARTAGDRRAKAEHLIAFESRNELFSEHALAILRSTMGDPT